MRNDTFVQVALGVWPAMGLHCKSVGLATKVRILHLPHPVGTAPELRKRGSGAVLAWSGRVRLVTGDHGYSRTVYGPATSA